MGKEGRGNRREPKRGQGETQEPKDQMAVRGIERVEICSIHSKWPNGPCGWGSGTELSFR